MKYIVFISAALGAILLYLLSHASTRTAASGHYYSLLLTLNMALAVSLIILIGIQLWRLYRQMRSSVMGSRLTLRLLGSFALMAIIPGVMVYAVSVNFLTRSIESWFNVKVEAALEGGLRLGQSALDIMLSDLEDKAETMALSLAFQPGNLHLSAINDLREKSGVRDAVLLTLQGRILAFSSSDPSSFLPDLPSVPQLRQGRQHVYGVIEPILGKGLYLRVLSPVIMNDMAGETRVLQLLQPVPKSLSETAEAVQGVYEDYQELSFSRESLKEVFSLTLTLVLMLAMLSSIAFAFVLSRRLSAPLGILAEGTRAIARGDYDTVLPAHGKDELGILVQSFNSMTRQLNDATQAAERNRSRVEAARGFLETILAHLSSGVLVLGEKGQLRTFNYAASHILDVKLSEASVNQPLDMLVHQQETLAGFVNRIQVYFKADAATEWQEQMEIQTSQGKQVLLVRGTRLPAGVDGGFVVVFDDITQMAQAQRDAAWAEVARRLAHEIKNPLTPIQLSAERLEHKLAAKLDNNDAEMLGRATATIIAQVNAMKTMVNEFSEYARLPVLNPSTVDLKQLIQDVLALYEAGNVSIMVDIPADLPKVYGDATMLRQVLHNLLQNAQDALDDHEQPEIKIDCKLVEDKVKLCVQDNGTGFPLEILSHAFEPYMTTKHHGTGLGLAIVKKIIEEHKGNIKVENLEHHGAIVTVTIPIAERKQ
ncbi:Signal transduction histidine kinase involved in nitrogen fixation and metabolism regulation [Methylobacillus rhizosphaerae]|uniref:histidine kinase n=1 Tax=Methylobacillus rhizosphaerae TaxID=551994 RepID=A0A238Z8D8_9PROT|nr:ATP-binding protein [Methylobacillus rhizosphaerae]SNR79103.1 Signal transduction histidine kinase involved in nitrogen fixation and metabolism regulation [Methylobacillus rhizosphaerae]